MSLREMPLQPFPREDPGWLLLPASQPSQGSVEAVHSAGCSEAFDAEHAMQRGKDKRSASVLTKRPKMRRGIDRRSRRFQGWQAGQGSRLVSIS